MDYQINFPHLGIFLKHVGKNISIGNFTIAYYGIVIAIGMLLGISAILKRAKETGQNPDSYFDISMFAMIIGVIGARVYYVIFAWDLYKDDLLSVFNIRQGGLAIYGGIIAGLVTIIFMAKRKHLALLTVLDTCCIGVPIGQILGRWGNFFNREAFGRYTDSLFAMQLPVSSVRSGEITAQMWEHVITIDQIQFIQVTPTFLYESLWNCMVLLVLVLIRNRTRFQGQLFFTYILGYGIGRFWIESLRTDQLLLTGTSIPISMLVSGTAVIASIVGMIVQYRKQTL